MAARTEPCGSCQGTGHVFVPAIQDKLAMHMVLTRGNPQGLFLAPQEVAELLDALGIEPPAPELDSVCCRCYSAFSSATEHTCDAREV
jgi:hypothetical protein